MQRLEIVLCCGLAAAALAVSCSSNGTSADGGGCSDTTCQVDSDCCPGAGSCLGGLCTVQSGGSSSGGLGGGTSTGGSGSGGSTTGGSGTTHGSTGSTTGGSSSGGSTGGGTTPVGQPCTVGSDCSSDYCRAEDGGMVCACNKANATKPYPCAGATDCCTGAVCTAGFCVAAGGSSGGSTGQASGGSSGSASTGTTSASAGGSSGGSSTGGTHSGGSASTGASGSGSTGGTHTGNSSAGTSSGGSTGVGTTGGSSTGAGTTGGSGTGGTSTGAGTTGGASSGGSSTGGGTSGGTSSGGSTGGTLPGDTCTSCGDSTACNAGDDCVCDPSDVNCTNPTGFCALDCYDSTSGAGNQSLCTDGTQCVEVFDYAGGGDDGLGDDYVCYPASNTCFGPPPTDTCNSCQTVATCATSDACVCDGNDPLCIAANGYCALDCFASASVCTGATQCVIEPDFAKGPGDDGDGNDYICYPETNSCVAALPGDTCSPCFGATGNGTQELCNGSEDCVCDPGGPCGPSGYCATDCGNGSGGADPSLCPSGTQCLQVQDFYSSSNDYACYPAGSSCAGLVCLASGSDCATSASCCSGGCDPFNGCN